MRIKEITSQHRRDFKAIFQCDHCDHEVRRDGYDDSYFHEIVFPAMKCEKCGKNAGENFRALAPKHPDGAQL